MISRLMRPGENRRMVPSDLYPGPPLLHCNSKTSGVWISVTILHFVIVLCIINGYVTMMESNVHLPAGKKRYKHLDFRVRLADQLISTFTSRPVAIRRRTAMTVIPVNQVDIAGHRLIRLVRKRSYCKSCASTVVKVRKDTVYGCSTCNLHFCSQSCLDSYH